MSQFAIIYINNFLLVGLSCFPILTIMYNFSVNISDIKVLDRKTQGGIGRGAGSGTSRITMPLRSHMTQVSLNPQIVEVGCRGAGIHTEGVSCHHEALRWVMFVILEGPRWHVVQVILRDNPSFLSVLTTESQDQHNGYNTLASHNVWKIKGQ